MACAQERSFWEHLAAPEGRRKKRMEAFRTQKLVATAVPKGFSNRDKAGRYLVSITLPNPSPQPQAAFHRQAPELSLSHNHPVWPVASHVCFF
jgi:hypothetical protein